MIDLREKLGSLKRRFGNRKRREGIALSSEKLLKAVKESEKGYLELGKDLHAFHEKAIEVSSTSSSLVGLMVGGQLIDLTKGLEGASEKMKNRGSESIQGTQTLATILEKAGRIESNLHPFQNVVRTLQVLCSFISIESVRLGAQKGGFDALSDDVRNLARTIQEKSSSMTEKSSALTMLLRENLARIQNFEKGQQDRSKLIGESIRTQLRALTERDEGACLRLKKIETNSEEIAKSIGEIVSSLQFHDITRQRIEHVRKALEKNHAGPSPSENDGGARLGAVPFLGNFLRFLHPVPPERLEERYQTYQLQKAQLLHTREELSSATGRISASLRSLAGRIAEVSREARGVTRDAQDQRESIFTQMEEAVLGLTSAIHDYDATNSDIASRVEEFTSAVSDMDGFLRDIVKIGIEMKMVALNAAIHAAHVGEWGLALGVLADHIHRLSQKTSGQIDSIGEDLRSIFDHALGLKTFAASVGSEKVEERARMAQSLTHMIPALKDLNAQAIQLLERIEREGITLSSEIEEKAGRVYFNEAILQCIDRLTEEIDKECAGIESELMKTQSLRGNGDRVGDIKELAQRYTMQRERDVHDYILGTAALRERPAQNGSEPNRVEGTEGKKEGDFGENVELF